MSPIIVSIEGNIGSGKSTFVEILKSHFGSEKRIGFVQEPVDEWGTICDKNGTTILQKFYENSSKYAFSFQMLAYISRLAILRKVVQSNNFDIVITERSVYTDSNVFAKMLYDDKKIEDIEYQIYSRWFEEFIPDLPVFSTIYIRTRPEIAIKRIEKRSREGENIPIDYLNKCHTYHETWLNGRREGCSAHHMEVDGNIDTEENPSIYNVWVENVEQFIQTLR